MFIETIMAGTVDSVRTEPGWPPFQGVPPIKVARQAIKGGAQGEGASRDPGGHRIISHKLYTTSVVAVQLKLYSFHQYVK
jgi:hypothetical protein